MCRKSVFQSFSIEMRQAAGHRKKANVHERLDGMRLQSFDESVQSAGGVADGEQRGQFDSIGCQRRSTGRDRAPLAWNVKAIR